MSPVTLRTLPASLAEGATTAAVLDDFPRLTEAHVRAAIAFGGASAQEDLLVGAARAVRITLDENLPADAGAGARRGVPNYSTY
jgi:hypothetical protein